MQSEQTPPLVVSGMKVPLQSKNDTEEKDRKNNSNSAKTRGRPKGRKTTSHPHLIRPKRPRSAYNFFFQDERNKVLRAAGLDVAITSTLEDVPKADHFKILIKNQFQENGKRKRGRPPGKHYRPRKTHERHGLIDFRKFAPTIGAKWKSLSSENRAPYEKQAQVERIHYQSAINEYKAEVKKYESCRECFTASRIEPDNEVKSIGPGKTKPNATENKKIPQAMKNATAPSPQSLMRTYTPSPVTSSQAHVQRDLAPSTASYIPIATFTLDAKHSQPINSTSFAPNTTITTDFETHVQEQHAPLLKCHFDEMMKMKNSNGTSISGSTDNVTFIQSERFLDFENKVLPIGNQNAAANFIGGTMQNPPYHQKLERSYLAQKIPKSDSCTNIPIAGKETFETKVSDTLKKETFHPYTTTTTSQFLQQEASRMSQPRNFPTSNLVFPQGALSSGSTTSMRDETNSFLHTTMAIPNMEPSISSKNRTSLPAASTLADIMERDLFSDDNFSSLF